MKCPNCNNELSEKVKFCDRCGTPVTSAQSTEKTSQSQSMQGNSNAGYSQPAQNNSNMQQFVVSNSTSKYKRTLSIIGFVVALISLFLPYYEANFFVSASVALIKGDGLLLIPFIVAGIILAVKNKIKGTIVPIAVLVMYFIYSIFNVNSDAAAGIVQFSTGFYVMALGIIMTIVAFAMYVNENKK